MAWLTGVLVAGWNLLPNTLQTIASGVCDIIGATSRAVGSTTL